MGLKLLEGLQKSADKVSQLYLYIKMVVLSCDLVKRPGVFFKQYMVENFSLFIYNSGFTRLEDRLV